MKDIPTNTSHTSSFTVTEAHTAIALGSGNLAVLGTPAMIAWMEHAAMEAIAPFVDLSGENHESSESSVGVSLNVEHLRASAVGNIITVTAMVSHAEGRRVDFEVSATDASGAVIGRGTHARFVVEIAKFMSKIEK